MNSGREFSSGTTEATTGFEPVIAVLQTAALPLGYVAERSLAGRNAILPNANLERG